MPAVFVIDRSATEPSPLVQGLIIAGYHTLCLADCNTALETLQCVRPDLIVIDVAAMSVDAAVGLLHVLGASVDAKAAVPVLVVGATLSDCRALGGLLKRGEILPAMRSTPEDVVARVRRYVDAMWPPTTRRVISPARRVWGGA